MSYWEDGTRRSTGNAFEPQQALPETPQQRRTRLHREADARRRAVKKLMEMKPSKTYEIPNQADSDKSRRIKGKP